MFKYQHFVKSMVAAIDAGTVAALATINLGSAYIQYIFSPKVHKNLEGKPVAIVGNSSNTIDEYSLLRIDISCLQSFIAIDKRSEFNNAYDLC